MVFIPNQHAVETLSAKRPYQTLDVRRCVGCAVRDRNRLSSRMPITRHNHASKADRHDTLFPEFSTRRGRPSWPNFPSLSWIRNLGCSSKHAFLTCCFVHSRVGCSVTLKWMSFRLESSIMMNRCHPVEPEDDQIEYRYDHEHKKSLHARSMKARDSKIQ